MTLHLRAFRNSLWVLLLFWQISVFAGPIGPEHRRQLRDDPMSALEAAERALDSTRDIGEQLDWHHFAAVAANMLALPKRALTHAEEALSLPESTADQDVRALLRAERLVARAMMGEEPAAVSGVESEIAAMKARTQESDALEWLRYARANLLASGGKLQQSLAEAQGLYARASEDSDTALNKAFLLPLIAYIYLEIGDLPRAEKLLKEAVELGEARNFPTVVSQSLLSLAFLEIRAGRFDEVEKWNARGEAIARRLRLDYQLGMGRVNMAVVALQRKQFAEAEAGLQYTLNIVERDHMRMNLPQLLQLRAMIEMQQGKLDAALQSSEEAIRIAENVGLPMNALYSLSTRAEILEKRGDYKAAFHTLRAINETANRVFTDEKTDALTELQVRFDVEREEYKNSLLTKENALQEQQLQEQAARSRWMLAVGGLLLALVVALAYLVWQTRRTRRELERLATTDPLTMLANRRQLMLLAHQEFERARRYDVPLTLVMIDLDHFKQINDRYGHATGDIVLKAFAVLAQKLLRQTDVIGRFGGEEFLLVCPHTAPDAALVLVDRLREEFSQLSVAQFRGEWQQTLSAGLSGIQASDQTVDDTIKRADEAVYAAKAKGRNRVEMFLPLNA